MASHLRCRKDNPQTTAVVLVRSGTDPTDTSHRLSPVLHGLRPLRRAGSPHRIIGIPEDPKAFSQLFGAPFRGIWFLHQTIRHAGDLEKALAGHANDCVGRINPHSVVDALINYRLTAAVGCE